MLEKLGAEQTRTGEWVNILGYVTSISSAPAGVSVTHEGPSIGVQALLLWAAGPLDLRQYRLSVEALQGQKPSPADESKPA